MAGTAPRAAAGLITRCHINQHVLRRNRQEGRRDPCVTVKQGRTNRYAHGVRIEGPSELVYRPERPLPCGATLWVETRAPVTLIEEAP